MSIEQLFDFCYAVVVVYAIERSARGGKSRLVMLAVALLAILMLAELFWRLFLGDNVSFQS
jgi:uncharacterized membrane protein YwaF